MNTSDNPESDSNSQTSALSLAALAKAAQAAQKEANTAYQHRKAKDKAAFRPPHPRGSRRSMGKR